MKKILAYTAMLLAVCLTGCKKDDPVDDDKKTPVSFTLEETVTRTSLNGTTTTFIQGDEISITSTGLETDLENSTYTVGANGTLSGESVYYNGSNPAQFYAHYPTTAEYSDGIVTMKVDQNQNSEELFKANDFMTASSMGNPSTGGQVKFQFFHRLTLVKVIWAGSTTASASLLNNILPEVAWKQTDNTLTTGGTAAEILMWKISQTGQEYWAVVPAQTVKQGEILVSIVDDDMSYDYELEKDVTFNANTIKTITLKLSTTGKVEADISEISVESWGEGDNQEGITVETQPEPYTLLSAAEWGRIGLNASTKATAKEGKWNFAVDHGNIEWSETENALHINLTSEFVQVFNDDGSPKKDDNGNDVWEEKAKWWNNAIYYRPSALDAVRIRPAVYKLTFKMKASAGKPQSALVQVLKGDESTNVYFGIYQKNPLVDSSVSPVRMYYPFVETAKVGEYVEFTYYVDFSKKVDASGNNVSEAKMGDYKNVLLTLSINTGTTDSKGFGVDFYFKDFEFKEIK